MFHPGTCVHPKFLVRPAPVVVGQRLSVLRSGVVGPQSAAPLQESAATSSA